MRIAPPPRHALITALTATFMLGAPMASAQVSPVPTSWLQLVGLLPAPTYDPYESQIPRRRPGHPPEPLPMFVEQNPDGLNPAPVDQVGEFVPVPDRWRIMEALGVNTPWYDPYNQNVLKGDKPINEDEWFFSMTGISDTLLEPRGIPTPVGPQAGDQPVADAADSDHVVYFSTAESPPRVTLKEYSGSALWSFEHLGNDYYKITEQNHYLVLFSYFLYSSLNHKR